MQPEYNTSRNPHYEGIDTSNEDMLWMQYIYMAKPVEIQTKLASLGHTMNSDNDALWAMQQEMSGNEDFVKYLFKLDPMHEDHAFVWNEGSNQVVNNQQNLTISPSNLVDKHLPAQEANTLLNNGSPTKCGNDDILCLIRETFTVRLNVAQIVMIGLGVIILYLIFKNDKAA